MPNKNSVKFPYRAEQILQITEDGCQSTGATLAELLRNF